MGTNYYARLKINPKLKEELIAAIKEDKYNKVLEMSQLLYGDRGDYNDGSVIHLGKRSAGWSFLWNTNARFKYDMETKSRKPELLYPLTKKGIRKFLEKNNAIIVSEYYSDDNPEQNEEDDLMSIDEFLEMAFNWKGMDSVEYNKKHPEENTWYSSERANFATMLGFYSPTSCDFKSDGLRFSTSTEFS